MYCSQYTTWFTTHARSFHFDGKFEDDVINKPVDTFSERIVNSLLSGHTMHNNSKGIIR